MDKRVRQLMLMGAGLSFLVAAPAVVLYAVGYRFLPSEDAAHPVGVLLVDTTPRKALVYVDGEARGTSPRAVSGLRAGEVQVRLAKEGYTTWEKQLEVTPTRATEVRAAKLFAVDANPVAIANGISHYSLSPNRRLLAVIDTLGRLRILDDTGELIRQPVVFGASPTELLWSPDSTQLATRVGGKHHIVSAADTTSPPEIISLPEIESLAWDPRLPGRLLALQASGELVSYSVSTRSRQVLAQEVTAFAPTSRSVVVYHAPNELVWYSLQGDIQRRHTLPSDAPIDALSATPGGNLAVGQDEKVFVIMEDGKVVSIASGASFIGWSPDGGILLLQLGSSELAIFNLENERVPYISLGVLQSILRLSRSIHHPQWFAGGTHVVFQVDDEVVISEVDTRDYPIQFTVDSTNIGNAAASVGEEGFSMYYLKSENGSTALMNRLLVLEDDQ